MKRFTDLRKIDTKDTIFEIVKELNSRSSIEMDEMDVASLLNLEGKWQAAFFTLYAPIKTSLESAAFTRFLSDLSMENAKGVAVGILGNHTLGLSAIRGIMNSIETVANQSALVIFSSSAENDAETGCLLFVLTTGVE